MNNSKQLHLIQNTSLHLQHLKSSFEESKSITLLKTEMERDRCIQPYLGLKFTREQGLIIKCLMTAQTPGQLKGQILCLLNRKHKKITMQQGEGRLSTQ